jgi:WD40-like Beta Propeller Repeat
VGDSFGTASRIDGTGLGSERPNYGEYGGEQVLCFQRASRIHCSRKMNLTAPPVWGAAVEQTIQQGTNNYCPLVSADGKTIYFASDNLTPTAGQQDIRSARRDMTASNVWTLQSTDIFRNVNGPVSEQPVWISPDECTLYLSSSRGGGTGWQIYVATRSP